MKNLSGVFSEYFPLLNMRQREWDLLLTYTVKTGIILAISLLTYSFAAPETSASVLLGIHQNAGSCARNKINSPCNRNTGSLQPTNEKVHHSLAAFCSNVFMLLMSTAGS